MQKGCYICGLFITTDPTITVVMVLSFHMSMITTGHVLYKGTHLYGYMAEIAARVVQLS